MEEKIDLKSLLEIHGYNKQIPLFQAAFLTKALLYKSLTNTHKTHLWPASCQQLVTCSTHS